MRKMLMAMVVGGAAVLGMGANAAPLPGPVEVPTHVAPQVQTVEWRGERFHEWRRHEARRDWRQHEHWARWHRWHERERFYSR